MRDSILHADSSLVIKKSEVGAMVSRLKRDLIVNTTALMCAKRGLQLCAMIFMVLSWG